MSRLSCIFYVSYFPNCNFNESSEIIVSICATWEISGEVQSSLEKQV